MRVITVKECLDCPYLDPALDWHNRPYWRCKHPLSAEMFLGYTSKLESHEGYIHPDCPLPTLEEPSREAHGR